MFGDVTGAYEGQVKKLSADLEAKDIAMMSVECSRFSPVPPPPCLPSCPPCPWLLCVCVAGQCLGGIRSHVPPSLIATLASSTWSWQHMLPDRY